MSSLRSLGGERLERSGLSAVCGRPDGAMVGLVGGIFAKKNGDFMGFCQGKW